MSNVHLLLIINCYFNRIKLFYRIIYATTTLFSIEENEYFSNIFKAQRPSQLPLRFTISNMLLDEKHHQITLHVQKKINDEDVWGVQVYG